MRRLLLPFALVLNVAAAALLWHAWQQQNELAALRRAIPPVPDLSGWPRVFADRVRLDSLPSQRRGDEFGVVQELALLYHANGFNAQAEQLEREIRKHRTHDAPWAYYLADLRLAAGDSREAEALLLETIQLDSSYAPAELKLGDLLLRLGRYSEAATHYESRLRLVPNDPYARLGLARVDQQQGKDASAVSRLENLVAMSPRFGTAHNLLSELYRLRGDIRKTEEHARLGSEAGRFREAEDPWMSKLAGWSYDPYRLQVLGATEMQTGRLQASLPFYEKSLELNPSDGSAYDALADVYAQLDRVDDARKTLERGLVAAPKNRTLYSTLSQILRKQQRKEEAVALLRRGLTVLPDDPELYNDLGVALDDVGRSTEATQAYRKAVQFNPNFAQAHLNLGLCLLQLGDEAGAQKSIQRALELRPSDSTALLVSAQTELDAGRAESAARFARLLIQFHPEYQDAHHLLALAQLQLGTAASNAGHADEAEQLFRAGLAQDDSVARLHGNLGALLSQRGNYTDALPHFQKFVALAPEEPIAYVYLGQVHLATNHLSDARAAFQSGLSAAAAKHDTELTARLESLLARAQEK